MKKIMILISTLLILLSSCNLDSDGIFEQIYNETEKTNIVVSYMVGEYDGNVYFSTKNNTIAKTSSPYSDYENVYSPTNMILRFIADDGKAVCTSQLDGTYYLVDLDEKTQQEISVTVNDENAIVQGVYFNRMPSETNNVLTLVLRTGTQESYTYYLYYGAQPSIDDQSLKFSTAGSSSNSVEELDIESGAPQIIGPGKYVIYLYENEDEQDSWTINDVTYGSAPRLWFNNLLILEDGSVYDTTKEELVASTVSLTHYDGNSILCAGYDPDTGKIYGITDKFTFSFDDTNFSYSTKSTNMYYVGMLSKDDGTMKVATAENSIQSFDISSL